MKKYEKSVSLETIKLEIEKIVNALKEEAINGFADQLYKKTRKEPSVLRKIAIKMVEKKWSEQGGGLSLVPGKSVLSRISDWAQKEFGCDISISALSREVRIDEIDREVIESLNAIGSNQKFKG
jgi:hypothetical protein